MKQSSGFRRHLGGTPTVSIALLAMLAATFPAQAQESLKVVPINSQAGSTSIYEVRFVTSDTLHPEAEIIIVFPAGFDLSGVKFANSTNINGGFKVTVNGNRVLLKRSPLGTVVLPGQTVDVKFASIRNPLTPAVEYSLNVQIKNKKEVVSPKNLTTKISFLTRNSTSK